MNTNYYKKIVKKSTHLLLKLVPRKFLVSQLQAIKYRKIFNMCVKYRKSIRSEYRQNKQKNHCNEILHVFKDHTDCLTSICFSPCSNYLVTGSLDKTALVYGINPIHKDEYKKIVHKFILNEDVNAVTFSPNGHYLLICCISINVYDVSELGSDNYGLIIQQVKQEDNQFQISSINFSPCGGYIAYACYDNSLIISEFSPNQNTIFKKIQDNLSIITCIEFSPCGLFLATSSDDRSLHYYKVITQYELQLVNLFKYEATNSLTSLSISSCGSYLALGGFDKLILFFDINQHSKNFGKTFLSHELESRITSISTCPYSCHLTVGCWDNSLIINKLDLVKPIKKIETIFNKRIHTESVIFTTYSKYGDYLATAGDDKTAIIFC